MLLPLSVQTSVVHVTAAVEYNSVMSSISLADATIGLIKVIVFDIVVDFDSLKACGAT